MAKYKWPANTQSALKAFYGDPAKGEVERQLVYIYPPFKMFYPSDDGSRSPVTRIRVHKKCAAAFTEAFNEIWLAYGKDQNAIDKAGLNEYNGGYEHRLIRGSTVNWSNHAFGAAIDINASQNPLGAKVGNMPQIAIDAFARVGFNWGGWYTERKDLMHFEAMDNHGHQPKNPAPNASTVTSALNVQPVKDEVEVDPVLKELQGVLLDMGYYETGEADGFDGGKTQAGIAAFLKDSQLAKYTTYATLLDYAKRRKGTGYMRPIAPVRAYATAADIAPKVESVKANKVNLLIGKVLSIPSAIGGAIWGTVSFIPDAYNAVAPYASIVKEYADTIPGWVYLLIISVGGYLIYRASKKTQQATVADWQTGRLSAGATPEQLQAEANQRAGDH